MPIGVEFIQVQTKQWTTTAVVVKKDEGKSKIGERECKEEEEEEEFQPKSLVSVLIRSGGGGQQLSFFFFFFFTSLLFFCYFFCTSGTSQNQTSEREGEKYGETTIESSVVKFAKEEEALEL